MIGRHICIEIIFLIIPVAYCYAQPVNIISNNGPGMQVLRSVALLKDTSKKMTADEIMLMSPNRWLPREAQKFYNLGAVTYPVWCSFKIKNETVQKLAFVINNAQVEWLDLYFAKGNKLYHKSVSVSQPFRNREILSNKASFLLDIPSDSTQTYYLRLRTNSGLKFPLVIYTMQALVGAEHRDSIFMGIYLGMMLVMILYNSFIYFSTRDQSYLLYVFYVALMTVTNMNVKGLGFEFFWPSIPVLNQFVNIVGCLTGIFAILFAFSFLHISKYAPSIKWPLAGLISLYVITITIILFRQRFAGFILTEIVSVLVALALLIAGIKVYNKGFRPAKFYMIAWSFLLINVIIYLVKDHNILPYNGYTENSMAIGSALEAMLLSLALADKINDYRKEKELAQEKMLLSMEENRKLVIEQNVTLENKVAERTSELSASNEKLTKTLQHLETTQSQLIQSEKMASLGELTAGIAHEIQNPLNFVNNFSDVNKELLEELKVEADKGNIDEVKTIATDVIANEEKINHHGKRADGIVKSMLEHSRASKGVKEPTEINKLADEYLRLAYHGMRAKNKSFEIDIKTDFDESIGVINVVPQDIGRVLLNLINNAFYAVGEKAKQGIPGYTPAVLVCTKKSGDKIEINVKDNGNGIPDGIKDKIFQPFFTTKPSGSGTGLGLSLSYDIIKAHRGDIKMESRKDEGSGFAILLPYNL